MWGSQRKCTSKMQASQYVSNLTVMNSEWADYPCLLNINNAKYLFTRTYQTCTCQVLSKEDIRKDSLV